MADHLAMSDEDFLKQPPPFPGEVSSQEDFEKPDEASKTTGDADANPGSADAPAAEPSKEEPGKEPEPRSEPAESEKLDAGSQEQGQRDAQGRFVAKSGDKEPVPSGSAEGKDARQVKEGEKTPEGTEPAKSGGPQEDASPPAPDYEGFYKQIMTPFTANGKKIELKDPTEAIQLMQMGANYTRKMQEIAPQRKLLTMLNNHGLMDESKLSFFIALDKGDPEAIKKLMVDKGVDPLDIDTKIEPAYREGSYRVSDEEQTFRSHLEDITSTDTGKQTLRDINDRWDDASKEVLWKQPELLPIIHAQRENGIYARIADEVDRLKTLGQLSPTTPFLEAYKTVGDRLQAAGAFGGSDKGQEAASGAGDQTQASGQGQQGASAEKPAPAVVTTRAAAPRPTVDNGDKAGAASPSRAAPGKAKEAVNFLSMSDDDFLKSDHFRGRL